MCGCDNLSTHKVVKKKRKIKKNNKNKEWESSCISPRVRFTVVILNADLARVLSARMCSLNWHSRVCCVYVTKTVGAGAEKGRAK